MKPIVYKRRQAQRKFAQGAFVPHTQGGPLIQANPLSEPVNTERVHKINMSAKSLLDMVSYDTFHKHQLRIVLERLNESTITNCGVAKPIVSPMKITQQSKAIVGPPKFKTTNKNIKDSRMKLRSQSLTHAKTKRAASSDIEDNQPLKYLKTTENTRAVSAKLKTNKNNKKRGAIKSPKNLVIKRRTSDRINRGEHVLLKEKIASPQPQQTTEETTPIVPVKHEVSNPEKTPNVTDNEKEVSSAERSSDIYKYDGPQRVASWVAMQTLEQTTPGQSQASVPVDVSSDDVLRLTYDDSLPADPILIDNDDKRPKPIYPRRSCRSSEDTLVLSLLNDDINTDDISVLQTAARPQCYTDKLNSLHNETIPHIINNLDKCCRTCKNCMTIFKGTQDHQTVYLNLGKDSLHVIRISIDKIQNTGKDLMTAGVVKRAEAQGSCKYIFENIGELEQAFNNCQTHSMNKDSVNIGTERPGTSRSRSQDSVGTTRNTRRENADTCRSRSQDSTCTSRNSANPKATLLSKEVEAPTFVLTEEEFQDPIKLIKKITPTAAKYGICKIVPPASFTPKCVLNNEERFFVLNQYVAKMYNRWGPAAREMCAIKLYAAKQKFDIIKMPLYAGLELDLQKLYKVVQCHGGLKKVLEKKRWGRVGDAMRLPKIKNMEKKLDSLFVKFLLPYEIMSKEERHEIMQSIEKAWNKKNQQILDWAMNPLNRQKKLLAGADTSEDETEDDGLANALANAEDCIVKGRKMNLPTFKKVAERASEASFGPTPPTPAAVEKEYWRQMLVGTEHVCVNAASVDTGDGGYGFSTNKEDPCANHPWNLKVLSQNKGNVLRSLGSVVGVTIPTLHLGMVMSTSCWHRDPHGLPWIEYMHEGPAKIWYGIPNEQSENFRQAMESLCPNSCQNKSIWLPSDIAMVPPDRLAEHNVALSRVEQRPGEYVVVLPKAYSCSISTGYTVSESVYFAPENWLDTAPKVFDEARESCEPTMFSLEQLLVLLAQDPTIPGTVLKQFNGKLHSLIRKELDARKILRSQSISERLDKFSNERPTPQTGELEECEICRTTLYLSLVTGITSHKSAACLSHALSLIKTAKYKKNLPSVQLVVRLTDLELNALLRNMRERMKSA